MSEPITKMKHFINYFIGNDGPQMLLFIPADEAAVKLLVKEVRTPTLQKISIEKIEETFHIYFHGKEKIYVLTNFQNHPDFLKEFGVEKKQIPMMLYKNEQAEYLLTLNG